MRIIVNGTPRDVSDGVTLLSLLSELNLDPDTLAVELNREVLLKNSYADVTLSADDKLELVRFVGGG